MKPADLIVHASHLVTMNAAREVLDDASIAVRGGVIVAIGPRRVISDTYATARELGGQHFLALPGFVDGHSHAGHGLVRTMGSDDFPGFREACRRIYMESASLEFWQAEARLSGLERIKAGVTTAVLYLGGGDENNRSDTPEVARTYSSAFTEIGPSLILGIGPSRPPFPRSYVHFDGDRPRAVSVDLQRMIEVCVQVADTLPNDATRVAFTTPVVNPAIHAGPHFEAISSMARTMKSLANERGMVLMIDGHRAGTVAHAAKVLDILDERTLLSHAIGLSGEEISLIAERGSIVANNAISASGIWDRCPVPELLQAGVRVILSSDGLSPDGGTDMFDVMRGAMRYHRSQARNPNLLPPGRALAMTTIDAANAFGIADEVGSLEVGKRADIVLIDTRKPHLQPATMPLHQTLIYANAGDVDTVVRRGQVVMQNRVVANERDILDLAQEQCQIMLERSGLRPTLALGPDFWADAYDRTVRDGLNHHRKD
jgi:5-methylthioadenosine/S-adenosylhomocysteine deaminase